MGMSILLIRSCALPAVAPAPEHAAYAQASSDDCMEYCIMYAATLRHVLPLIIQQQFNDFCYSGSVFSRRAAV